MYNSIMVIIITVKVIVKKITHPLICSLTEPIENTIDPIGPLNLKMYNEVLENPPPGENKI